MSRERPRTLSRLHRLPLLALVLVHFTVAGLQDFGRHVQSHVGDARHAHTFFCLLESFVAHTGAHEEGTPAPPGQDQGALDCLLSQAGLHIATALAQPPRREPPAVAAVDAPALRSRPVATVTLRESLARGPPAA